MAREPKAVDDHGDESGPTSEPPTPEPPTSEPPTSEPPTAGPAAPAWSPQTGLPGSEPLRYGQGQPTTRKRNGLATASLVLGIVGLVLAVIPFANFAAYPLVILAVVFGLVAFKWGKAKAGLVLGIVGLIATITWSAAIGSVFNNAVNKSHTVAYSVTGTIGKADISYESSDSSSSDHQSSTDNVPLPWTKTISVKGDISIFMVTANTHIGPNTSSGQLSCTLSVDGKVVSTDSQNGDADFVTCSGTGYQGK